MSDITKPLRIAFYLRVSTDEQVDAFGLDLQLQGLNDLLEHRAKHHGWVHKKEWEFVDAGLSGKDLNRPQFKALMECVKRKEVDLVAVWKIDRLSRNLTHLLHAFEEMQKYDVSFYSLKENVDFTGPIGKLTFQIFGALAEFERETIKMRTMEGKLASARQGNYTGAGVPYGYAKVKNTDKKGSKLVIVPEEAKWVEQIFYWFVLDRKSIEQIAKELNRLKVPKSQRKGETVKAREWYATTVADMLRNTVYTGYRQVNYKDFKDSGIVVENAPQIVPKGLFDQVAEIMKELAKTNGSWGGGKKEYLLSRKIINPLSGRSFIGYKRTKGGVGYRHKVFINEQGERFPNIDIPGDVVERFVWNEILKAINDPKRFFKVYQKQVASGSRIDSLEREVQLVLKRSAEAQKRLNNLIEDYCAGGINQDIKEMKQLEYQKVIDEAAQREKELTSEISELLDQETAYKSVEEFGKHFKGKLDNVTFEQKRTIIQVLVDRIEVYEDLNKRKRIVKVIFRFAKPKKEQDLTEGEPKNSVTKTLNAMLSALNYLSGTPDRVRTCDLWFRKPTLYPAELRVHMCFLLDAWYPFRASRSRDPICQMFAAPCG